MSSLLGGGRSGIPMGEIGGGPDEIALDTLHKPHARAAGQASAANAQTKIATSVTVMRGIMP